jgi:hypothetical protein
VFRHSRPDDLRGSGSRKLAPWLTKKTQKKNAHPLKIHREFIGVCVSAGATDSTDHISHMVYAGDNGCPKTHPHVFPRVIVTVKYDTSLGANSQLAIARGEDPAHADPATGVHADYFEAWKPGTLEFFVGACIRAGINCRDGDRLP